MTNCVKIDNSIHAIEGKETKTLCGIDISSINKRDIFKIKNPTCIDCFAIQRGLIRIIMPCYGIEVLLGRKHSGTKYLSGSVFSNLLQPSPDIDKFMTAGKSDANIVSEFGEAIRKCEEHNEVVRTIETMILEQAKKGIDIVDPKYVKGIKLIVESCLDNLPE